MRCHVNIKPSDPHAEHQRETTCKSLRIYFKNDNGSDGEGVGVSRQQGGTEVRGTAEREVHS